MDKLKQIGRYLFFGGVIGVGVVFDTIGAGGVENFIAQLGLSDGMMGAAIAYLVWENKTRLEKMDVKMDKIQEKINKWDK